MKNFLNIKEVETNELKKQEMQDVEGGSIFNPSSTLTGYLPNFEEWWNSIFGNKTAQ